MIEIKVPELAESITEGTIANWLKAAGDSVSQGEAVAELETDKVNIEVNAENAGVLKDILKEVGDTVQVGEVIATLDENGATAESGEKKAADEEESQPKETGEAGQKSARDEERPDGNKDTTEEISSGAAREVVASPGARKLARERGIDLGRVQGQDPSGRVTEEDVKAYAKQPSTKDNPSQVKGPKQEADVQAPADNSQKPVERQRMSRRRQTIANRLVEVQQTAAMLTTFNEVDMTAILDLRSRRKEKFREQHDVNLGFMSFFTKAVVGALKAFPLLNAEIDGQDMLIKKYYDIGIAVSTEEGLVVPIVRDADRLSFAEIEKEIATLAEKARSNSLKLNEIQGGTFSITNGGVFGSLLSTPILNGSQVGILGMHTIQKRPVAVGDTVEIRPMMYLALSYDHRIVDGKEAVSFLVKVKQMLEDPETLLLEG